jgi:hypothetical protein
VRAASETRKQIYQDRKTDELRAAAAKVCRELRLGAKPEANGTKPSLDLDALLAALTPEQQALLAAKINAPTGPGTGPKKKSPGPVRIPAIATASDFKASRERCIGPAARGWAA